jgi:hypothetical protein
VSLFCGRDFLAWRRGLRLGDFGWAAGAGTCFLGYGDFARRAPDFPRDREGTGDRDTLTPVYDLLVLLTEVNDRVSDRSKVDVYIDSVDRLGLAADTLLTTPPEVLRRSFCVRCGRYFTGLGRNMLDILALDDRRLAS